MTLPFDDREIVLRADFDQLDSGGVLSVPVRDDGGPRPPQPGEFVYLLDGMGQGCIAFVAKIREGIARLRPVPETWIRPQQRARDRGGVHRTLSVDALAR